MQSVYTVESEVEMQQFANQLGARLRGGEMVELSGDLGSGKTTLTRGLVAGAGSLDQVSSPTFTVSKHYSVPETLGKILRTIVHIDLYRLTEPGLMDHELAELIDDSTVSVVIEWADIAEHVLPKNRLSIHLQATGLEGRQLKLTYPSELAYLLVGIAIA